MNDTTNRSNKGSPPDKGDESKRGAADRKTRLAEQLRANLQKRKAQSRSRRAGGPTSSRTGSVP
ncbi:hypothetical protein [Mesorhizobium sp. M9A.F.Ca.ET.002.03.1.2]|uniref:hypothetical protein n=1 Tax=Mesorhizobium sp. M9A.F.Ca.ET.002.03.1.2 TaxID=2493668 RepID=UPI001FE1EFD7|nr:hypothetical protein [Mesorhizobium sp. M9A.F.Ca.ET.002.03.1.2]